MAYTKYPAMTSAQVKAALERVRGGEEIEISDYLTSKESAAEYSESYLPVLRKAINEVRSRYPESIALRSRDGFEAEVCGLVHSIMKDLPREALDDPDFWKYLAVTHFRDLIEWRHGGIDREANLANYGVSAERRNLLLRMFYRAAVVYEQGEPDPYYLARQGDEDLWKSHFGAVRVGNCPNIVKAFLKKVFPIGKAHRLKTIQVRQLAKNLNRLRSNIIFELYSLEASLTLIEREVKKIEMSKE